MRNESHRCSALRRAEDQNVSIPSVSSHILPSLFSYLHFSLACTPLLTQTRTSITMMEQYDHYSTFEVDGSHIPGLAPDATQLEAINVGEKEVASWSPMRTAEEKISTVARSRATYIWIALFSLILIAIAVGVGVGVTQHKRSEQSNSEAENQLHTSMGYLQPHALRLRIIRTHRVENTLKCTTKISLWTYGWQTGMVLPEAGIPPRCYLRATRVSCIPRTGHQLLPTISGRSTIPRCASAFALQYTH